MVTLDYPFVPKLGTRPSGVYTCGFCPTGAEVDYCGKPAAWHVMWDGELDNSLACDEHMEMILRRWVFKDRHPVCVDCTMPGSLWLFRLKRCEVPWSGGSALSVESVDVSSAVR